MSAHQKIYNEERFPKGTTDKFNSDPPALVEENAEALLESFNRKIAEEAKRGLENE